MRSFQSNGHIIDAYLCAFSHTKKTKANKNKKLKKYCKIANGKHVAKIHAIKIRNKRKIANKSVIRKSKKFQQEAGLKIIIYCAHIKSQKLPSKVALVASGNVYSHTQPLLSEGFLRFSALWLLFMAILIEPVLTFTIIRFTVLFPHFKLQFLFCLL